MGIADIFKMEICRAYCQKDIAICLNSQVEPHWFFLFTIPWVLSTNGFVFMVILCSVVPCLLSLCRTLNREMRSHMCISDRDSEHCSCVVASHSAFQMEPRCSIDSFLLIGISMLFQCSYQSCFWGGDWHLTLPICLSFSPLCSSSQRPTHCYGD